MVRRGVEERAWWGGWPTRRWRCPQGPARLDVSPAARRVWQEGRQGCRCDGGAGLTVVPVWQWYWSDGDAGLTVEVTFPQGCSHEPRPDHGVCGGALLLTRPAVCRVGLALMQLVVVIAPHGEKGNVHIRFNGFCFAAENKQSQITVYKDLQRTLLVRTFFSLCHFETPISQPRFTIWGAHGLTEGGEKNLYFQLFSDWEECSLTALRNSFPQQAAAMGVPGFSPCR